MPRQVVSNIPPGSFDASQLTSVGGDPMAWLQHVPQQFRPAIEQLIPNFVQGFHQAISLAIAGSFWLGVGAAIVAALATALLVEVPLRTTFGHEGEAQGAPASIPVPTLD